MDPKKTTIEESDKKVQVMSSSEIDRTLLRLAHEIIIRNGDVQDLALIGIRRRGIPLAERLSVKIKGILDTLPMVGELDITYHRDDRSRDPR